jgi:hypothetical protein
MLEATYVEEHSTGKIVVLVLLEVEVSAKGVIKMTVF